MNTPPIVSPQEWETAREQERGARTACRQQEFLQRQASHVRDHAAPPYSSWRFHHWYGGVCG